MDTSVLLCPIGTMITPCSVIQTSYFGQWPNYPILATLPSFDDGDDPMLEQHNRSPYKRLNVLLLKPCSNLNISVRSTKPLDDIGSQGYDYFEEQSIKITSGEFDKDRRLSTTPWETLLYSLDSDLDHQALSPCNGITYNVRANVLVGTTYIDAQTVKLSPGVFLDHSFCCDLEDVRFFYWSA